MRFRRLTLDELKELHQEFIQFLSSNTITGDDWKKIKEEDYPKAEKLIEVFSDIVIEKSLSNIKYLEKREPGNILLFHCKEKEVNLIAISLIGNADIDLTNDEHISLLAKGDFKADINSFKTSKPYQENREDEVFKMLNEGCLISDGKLFKTKAL